ncbi:YugN family protein [Cytobacillus sp. S13-E01]|uniref:YugN family protein n=1 Tax=Cytobacillus sp. S13-E01 TaxID=3031326 RepID=UPI0023D8A4E5|nr:YugN family protein [Cytobacillus sp. S13-E01]MDF0725315.1 YugN family protein [Cytobacillus sp. S13-E01]
MKFDNTGIENQTVDLSRLNSLMEDLGFVLAGQWDYERATYDRKFETKGEVFYLRVQGYAIEGEIDSNHAVVKILAPLLGKHYYPHGVEYGEGETFPKSLIEQSQKLIAQIKEGIEHINQ